MSKYEVEWLDRRKAIPRERCDGHADAVKRVRDRYPAAALSARGSEEVMTTPRGQDFCPKCKPRRKHRRRSRTTITLVNNERKTERG